MDTDRQSDATTENRPRISSKISHVPYKIIVFAFVLVVLGIIAGILVQKFLASSVNKKIVVNGSGSLSAVADSAFVLATINVPKNSSYPNNPQSVLRDTENKLNALGIPDRSIGTSTDSLEENNVSETAYTLAIHYLPTTFVLIPKTLAVFNSVKGIQHAYAQYAISDTTKLSLEVRKKALDNARKQAEIIAQVNHAKIVKIISFNDQNIPFYQSEFPVDNSKPTMNLYAEYRVEYELSTPFFPF